MPIEPTQGINHFHAPLQEEPNLKKTTTTAKTARVASGVLLSTNPEKTALLEVVRERTGITGDAASALIDSFS